MDLFDEMNITEIIDSENNEMRYMLCKNEKEKFKERNTREALINKVEVLLCKKAAVKKKRDKKKTCASIGRIFEKIKTVLLELRPIHHKTDERITGHIFIVMLAYYLQWHFMQRVVPLFAGDGKGEERRWSFDIIVKRLKSITKVEQIIKNIVVKTNISKPDAEQNEILKLLKIKL